MQWFTKFQDTNFLPNLIDVHVTGLAQDEPKVKCHPHPCITQGEPFSFAVSYRDFSSVDRVLHKREHTLPLRLAPRNKLGIVAF